MENRQKIGKPLLLSLYSTTYKILAMYLLSYWANVHLHITIQWMEKNWLKCRGKKYYYKSLNYLKYVLAIIIYIAQSYLLIELIWLANLARYLPMKMFYFFLILYSNDWWKKFFNQNIWIRLRQSSGHKFYHFKRREVRILKSFIHCVLFYCKCEPTI